MLGPEGMAALGITAGATSIAIIQPTSQSVFYLFDSHAGIDGVADQTHSLLYRTSSVPDMVDLLRSRLPYALFSAVILKNKKDYQV